MAITVHVNVANSANAAQATAAATNFAKALSQLVAKLMSVSGSTSFTTPNGLSTTVGAVLADLNNTDFMVNDKAPAQFANGGGGAAIRDPNGGRNTDEISYTYLIGNGSYGDPNYTDNQGLIGIALHELGHISAAGAAVDHSELFYYNMQYPKDRSYSGFASSAYWTDNEEFADQFERTVGASALIDLSQYNTAVSKVRPGSYLGASTIFNGLGGS